MKLLLWLNYWIAFYMPVTLVVALVCGFTPLMFALKHPLPVLVLNLPLVVLSWSFRYIFPNMDDPLFLIWGFSALYVYTYKDQI